MATKIVKPPKLINVVRQAKQGRRAKGVPDGVSNLSRLVRSQEAKNKVCKGCGKRRKIEEFFFRKKGGSVRSSRCKFCAAEAQRMVRVRKKELAKLAKKGKKGR